MAGGRSADDLVHIAEEEAADAKKDKSSLGRLRTFDEFECPTCEAYNPHADFGNGDEVVCAYCGIPFTVVVTDEGKLKMRES
jgi:hypothetical protein